MGYVASRAPWVGVTARVLGVIALVLAETQLVPCGWCCCGGAPDETGAPPLRAVWA